MGIPTTRIATYSLRRSSLLIDNLELVDLKVQYDGNFKSHIVQPNQGKFEFSSKIFMLEEVEARYISVKDFLSQKGIRSSSSEDLYANTRNFVEIWTQPGNVLFFPKREIKLYLGYTLIENIIYYAIAYKKEQKYSMVLSSKIHYTESHDFWLV